MGLFVFPGGGGVPPSLAMPGREWKIVNGEWGMTESANLSQEGQNGEPRSQREGG